MEFASSDAVVSCAALAVILLGITIAHFAFTPEQDSIARLTGKATLLQNVGGWSFIIGVVAGLIAIGVIINTEYDRAHPYPGNQPSNTCAPS